MAFRVGSMMMTEDSIGRDSSDINETFLPEEISPLDRSHNSSSLTDEFSSLERLAWLSRTGKSENWKLGNWDTLQHIVHEKGCQLYDVEVPRGDNGVLRVFIYRNSPVRSTVGLGECAAISRAILALEPVEDLLPGDCTLEVSTPGINRKLRYRSHYQGAVGERVLVTHRMLPADQNVPDPLASGTLEKKGTSLKDFVEADSTLGAGAEYSDHDDDGSDDYGNESLEPLEVRSRGSRKEKVTGILEAVEDTGVTIVRESDASRVVIPWDDLSDGRVDFQF